MRRIERAIGTTRVIAVVVILAIIILAGAYVALNNSHNTIPSSSTTPTSSISTLTSGLGRTSSSTGSSSARTSIVEEEQDQVDSLDPAVTFETPGWEIVDQVYQGLVAPDRTSITAFVGVLAQNWTVSSSGMNYTFYLRPGVTFSNSDHFNAYSIWFSLYRTMIMNQAGAWVLGQNLGLYHGPVNVTESVLNSINYANPSPQNATFMEYPSQAVQVVNASVIELNLGYGYNGVVPFSAFLATLTTVMAFAVDPVAVEANGGVVADQPNNWMSTNMVGTGFYKLQQWLQGQSLTLVKNANYWASNLPASQLNYAIQPAMVGTVDIYYKTTSAMIADLKSGFAQIVNVPTSQYNVVKAISGVNVTQLPIEFGSAEYAYSIYMDPYAFAPFQDLRVREAVASAIDYQHIIGSVLGGLGDQWVGPVPPGFQYYNQSTLGLQPYSYNAVGAAQLLSQAGYKATYPNGTVTPGTPFPSVNFCYDSDSDVQTETAQIVQGELQAIGITVTLTPFSFVQWGNIVDDVNNSGTSYPFGIFFWAEDYTNSLDYVATFTQAGYVGVGGYNGTDIGGVNASDLYSWATNAATATDNNTVIQSYQNITRSMYDSYAEVWLFVPVFLSVHQQDLTGFIPNPAGSAAGFFLFYNTIQYT